MTSSNAIALALAVGVAAVFAPSANAQQTTESILTTGFTNTRLTITETPCSATVSITGGPIRTDEIMLSVSIGTWWQVEVSGRVDDTQDDEIYFTLSLQHIAECDDPHPRGTPWTWNWIILAEQYSDGSYVIPGPVGTREHGDHTDRFFRHRLDFSKSTDNFPTLDQDEIDSWTYTLQAEHVPAPGALVLAGVGAMLVARRRTRA